jgi:hypothetical protein
MKIQLTYFIIALILLSNAYSLQFDVTLEKMDSKKQFINIRSKSESTVNKDHSKLLNFTRNHYQNTEASAENFLHEISRLVISDFEVLKKHHIKGITFEILRDMIHNDKDFGNNVSDEELQKKFVEYDVLDKGYLDKVTYSGILSEFMLAKAALKKLSKFIEEPFEEPLPNIHNDITDNSKTKAITTMKSNKNQSVSNSYVENNSTLVSNNVNNKIPVKISSKISEKLVINSNKNNTSNANKKTNNTEIINSNPSKNIHPDPNIQVIFSNKSNVNHQGKLEDKKIKQKEINEKQKVPEKKENPKLNSDLNYKYVNKNKTTNDHINLILNNTKNEIIKNVKSIKTEVYATNNMNHFNKVNETNKENHLILNSTINNKPIPKAPLIVKNEESKVIQIPKNLIPFKPTTPGIQLEQKEFKEIKNQKRNNFTHIESNNKYINNKTSHKPIIKLDEIINSNITKKIISESKKHVNTSIIIKNITQLKKHPQKQNKTQPTEIQKEIINDIIKMNNKSKNNSTEKIENFNLKTIDQEIIKKKSEIIVSKIHENNNISSNFPNSTENLNNTNSNTNATIILKKRKFYPVIITKGYNSKTIKNKESQNFNNIDANNYISTNYNYKKNEKPRKLRIENIQKNSYTNMNIEKGNMNKDPNQSKLDTIQYYTPIIRRKLM